MLRSLHEDTRAFAESRCSSVAESRYCESDECDRGDRCSPKYPEVINAYGHITLLIQWRMWGRLRSHGHTPNAVVK